MDTPPREVSSRLDVTVAKKTDLEFQITVAAVPGIGVDEELTVTIDGSPVEPEEVVTESGNRIHRLQVEDDHRVLVDYHAVVHAPGEPLAVTSLDRSIYLRPSRYAEADKFFGFVAGQFDLSEEPGVLLNRVTDFVRSRLNYLPGASDPIDGATDTLLANAGVCRDFAHLVVALLRALNIPARLVAVYAPGCHPMDFHAVAEAVIDDEWVVVDATGLAPRSSLVRIATGRDAADTAFLDNHGGNITMNSYSVTAITQGPLPQDDGTQRVSIA
ncbi:transglutaminase-like domain-containing protein [Williamsia sterculiae]|uniref:Transglutaminase-like superfamily protein n=1 Tax=Williamsia sterculiae TaxID=1344003 RepID=A0A1N7GZH1_9NOCA|nr:transglutaminase-like domain-containing protein [Williamsia sterculiae]SIS17848.1 Transglutaminase-like superfamily protein [Williamsia sterculiae]